MQLPPGQMVKEFKHGIGTDLLLVFIILAGFFFITSLVPLAPNDFWWHLRVGQQIFTEFSIPTTNIYGWSIPSEQPFFYGAWLGELLLYLLHHIGGLMLDMFARNVIIAITFLLVAVEAHRRSGSWRITSLVLALGCLMSTNNLLVRPQMWAFPLFMILYSLLSRYQEGQLQPKWLLACPVLMILWVNLHGSFVIGLCLVGIFLVGNAWKSLLKQPGSLTKPRLTWLFVIFGLSTCAILVNPRFYHILSYVKGLLTDPTSQNLIQEWQSPTPVGLANSAFYLSILILITALAFIREKFHPTNLLLIASFLWLAWSGVRYVIWYGMIVMPILAQTLSHIPFHMPAIQTTRNRYNLLIAFLLFMPVVVVQPWLVEHTPLPATYWSWVQNDPAIGPLLSIHTPIAAARYLQTNPGGRLFNELGYGSYLIWAVPGQRVFVDPRIELYPQHIWDDYIDISNGVNPLELLDRHGIDRVLLDLTLQPELSIALSNSTHWRIEYQDNVTQIWISRDVP